MNQNPNNGQNFNQSQMVRPNVPTGQPVQPQVPRPQNVQPNNAQQFIKQTPAPQAPKKKKKGLSKELVTIIGVILIVGILYFAYNYTLNKNLEITANIPVAATRIEAGEKITQEDIKYIDVPASTLRTIGAITDVNAIVNKYVLYDTNIPEGSFFYGSVLSESDESPDSIFRNLEDDEIAVTIDVDLERTYGNSIMPGNKIDIYARADRINSKGKIEYIIGPLITQAEVLAVKDASGNDVFADHQNKGTPSMFIFGMNSDIASIVFKAKRLESTEYNVELFPVVNGKFEIEEFETLLSENEIKDMIENATVAIREETNE
ncbi:MAG: hypothetical protein IJB71_01980 [Bacilli bacterium]|nr:hypothetical protein [Bacilli bacterium]